MELDLARNKKMVIVIAVLVVGLAVLGIYVSRFLVGKSRLLVQSQDPHFPRVSGYNLDRQEFEFPRDFEGELNLVIIPFQQSQQLDVNTWIPTAQHLERTYPGLVYYELPTIYKLPALYRTFINEGMRAGIPDQTSRERTITFYLDKRTFKSALDIRSEDMISIFLVDRQGNILWREEGLFTEEKVSGLAAVLDELQEK
jgi:hypothetical protein